MAEGSLRSAIDAIGRRLQEELEEQLTSLTARHQEEMEAARRTAEAEAEQRWSARVDAVRTEWTARLDSEVAAARAEAERRMVAESMRLRVEAEQAAAESTARVRQELEQALNEERERGAARLSSERQQLSSARDQLQQDLEARSHELDALKQQFEDLLTARRNIEATLEEERRTREEETKRLSQAVSDATGEARVAERQAQLAIVERLLAGIRSMDAGRSLTDVLTALLTSAAAEAPRVALFVVHGSELRAWKAEGFGRELASLQIGSNEEGLLGDVLRRAEPVVTADDAGPTPPPFAELPPDSAAIAVPLFVGAQPVAILYADDGAESGRATPAAWPEAIQILARHASVNLAHLTAARAAEAMRRSLAPASAAPVARQSAPIRGEDGNSARRYARLLVSEIKLYNEAAVRIGRQKRDLLERLKPEIDRARHLYEQRISSSVDSRGALFHQELVQTLADGDPALLGGPA
jgi:GAF domain